MPLSLYTSCYGSDGERLVVAGGLDSRLRYHDEVLVLQGAESEWRQLNATLTREKAYLTGVLVDNFLICISGWDTTADIASTAVDVINIDTGDVMEGPRVPLSG